MLLTIELAEGEKFVKSKMGRDTNEEMSNFNNLVQHCAEQARTPGGIGGLEWVRMR